MVLWSRVRRVSVRLVVIVLLITAALYASVRIYVAYEVRRATSMLAEASRVRVGAAEATVLPLVARYRGYKWITQPLPPRENSTDLREYDYRKNIVSDYHHVFEVSPFDLLTVDDHMQRGRVTRAIRTVINAVPKRLRAAIGMRDWGTTVDLAVRGGRVQSVSGSVLVEGHSKWLGHEWTFTNAMPHSELQGKAFVIDSAILEMENGGGMLIQNTFMPEASDEAVLTAREFNAACLTSIRGCEDSCDIAPHAVEYVKQYPEVGWGINPPKCR